MLSLDFLKKYGNMWIDFELNYALTLSFFVFKGEDNMCNTLRQQW